MAREKEAEITFEMLSPAMRSALLAFRKVNEGHSGEPESAVLPESSVLLPREIEYLTEYLKVDPAFHELNRHLERADFIGEGEAPPEQIGLPPEHIVLVDGYSEKASPAERTPAGRQYVQSFSEQQQQEPPSKLDFREIMDSDNTHSLVKFFDALTARLDRKVTSSPEPHIPIDLEIPEISDADLKLSLVKFFNALTAKLERKETSLGPLLVPSRSSSELTIEQQAEFVPMRGRFPWKSPSEAEAYVERLIDDYKKQGVSFDTLK